MALKAETLRIVFICAIWTANRLCSIARRRDRGGPHTSRRNVGEVGEIHVVPVAPSKLRIMEAHVVDRHELWLLGVARSSARYWKREARLRHGEPDFWTYNSKTLCLLRVWNYDAHQRRQSPAVRLWPTQTWAKASSSAANYFARPATRSASGCERKSHLESPSTQYKRFLASNTMPWIVLRWETSKGTWTLWLQRLNVVGILC